VFLPSYQEQLLKPVVKNGLCVFMCRPDLIEYNKLTKAVPTYNLNNAFNVAEDRLGLTRLLDPEGWHFQPCDFVSATSILYASVELGLSVRKLTH